MKSKDFNDVVNSQAAYCLELLTSKGKEYDTDESDRLKSFKEAAAILNSNQVKAIASYMAKHVVSIYDMCMTGKVSDYKPDKWIEKITDNINYLLILRAAIEEEYSHHVEVCNEQN